jgi:hypothetical protein
MPLSRRAPPASRRLSGRARRHIPPPRASWRAADRADCLGVRDVAINRSRPQRRGHAIISMPKARHISASQPSGGGAGLDMSLSSETGPCHRRRRVVGHDTCPPALMRRQCTGLTRPAQGPGPRQLRACERRTVGTRANQDPCPGVGDRASQPQRACGDSRAGLSARITTRTTPPACSATTVRAALHLHAERHVTCSARAGEPRSTPERACFTTGPDPTLTCAAREVTLYLAVPSPLLPAAPSPRSASFR